LKMSNTDVRYSSVNDEIEIEIEQTETPSPVLSRPVSRNSPSNGVHSRSLTIFYMPIFACVFYTLVLTTISVYDLITLRWDVKEIVRHFNITL